MKSLTIEDAFKTLEEVLDEDVERKISFSSLINESKKKKALKESEKIDLSDGEEVKKGKEILNQDKDIKDNVEKIVDVDATTIGELKDSYVGNVILQCPVCKTLIYKKPSAINDDGEGIYNKEEECPHCGSIEGFELVGQVANMDVKTDEVESTTGMEVDFENVDVEPKEAPTIEETQEEVKEEEKVEETPEEKVEETKEEEEVVDDLNKQKKDITRKYGIKGKPYESLNSISFNKLVNDYLNEAYDTIKEFKAISGFVSSDNNKLLIEGEIEYKNGNKENTKFMFEKCYARDGKIIYKGINETFSKKPSYRLVMESNRNRLNGKSLTYNYVSKTINEGKEEKKVISGRVSINR